MKIKKKDLDNLMLKINSIKRQLICDKDYYDTELKEVFNYIDINQEYFFTVRLDDERVTDIIEKILNTSTYSLTGSHSGKLFRSHSLSNEADYLLKNTTSRNFICNNSGTEYPLISAEKFIEIFKEI